MPSEDPMDELWVAELQFLIEEVQNGRDWETRVSRLEEAYALIERKADEVFETTGYFHPGLSERMNSLREIIERMRK